MKNAALSQNSSESVEQDNVEGADETNEIISVLDRFKAKKKR